jgi:hypothetical protein
VTLLLLWAAVAAAQSPMPSAPPGTVGFAAPEAKSTGTAAAPGQPEPAMSSPAVKLGDDMKTLDDAPKPAAKKKKKKRNPEDEPWTMPKVPIQVKIHKVSADWTPVSVKAGGSAAAAKNSAVWKLVKKGKKISGGVKSKAKSVARLYPSGEDKKIVVAIFPEGLAKQRTHVEVRFQVVEGYLEKVAVVAVTAEPGGEPTDDAGMLRLRGVSFQEEKPASAQVLVSGIDAKVGKRAFNGGTLKLAEFSESQMNPRSLGLTSVEWMAKGLLEPKP